MTLRGQIANAQGDPDGAIGDFISAIELDAAAPTAYLERGKIYEERGKIEAALADYTAAAEADPHDPAAWYRRGLLYLSMDEMVLAVEDLWSAHIRSPQVASSDDPIEMIAFVLEARGLSRRDLIPLIGTRQRVWDIMEKRRRLTLPMIRRLEEHLKIPTDVLIQEYALHQEAG